MTEHGKSEVFFRIEPPHFRRYAQDSKSVAFHIQGEIFRGDIPERKIRAVVEQVIEILRRIDQSGVIEQIELANSLWDRFKEAVEGDE
jgi:hypothetical protein